MPQLGETVLEGAVSTWYKKAGDPVKVDEPLFEVETDKVTVEIPAPATGVVSAILVEAGVSVKVGTRLAVIESAEKQVQPESPPSETAAPVSTPATVSAEARHRLSPSVRRLLREHGIDAAEIQGTARGGRITPEDVRAYLDGVARKAVATPASAEALKPLPAHEAPRPAQPPVAPAALTAAGRDDVAVPMNRIRRATAAHMVRSVATSPHVLQAIEVDFSAVESCRRAHGAAWKAQRGFSLTYLPFIARAVCAAIAKFPHVNATVGNEELIVHRRVHLGIAVDLDFEGLLVPVVRDAHHQNLRGLAAAINELVSRARQAALKPDELSGATYTISNSGPFGTLITAPIISQPQVAILSTDGVRKKPVVVEAAGGDAIAICPVGVIAQSFDHRAFDGAYSAAFLRELKLILEGRDWLAELGG